MFHVRRIYDNTLPLNKEAISQVQQILRTQFYELPEEDIDELPHKLLNPLKYRFRTMLIVAEDEKRRVKGFALLLHAADVRFCYLDYISAAQQKTGRGIGGALYEIVRDTARELDVTGLFFECLPDDADLCRDPDHVKQNAARLRFYERYGARPITGTKYETPLTPGDDCPPYLVFDDLGSGIPLSQKKARAIVWAILERKYGTVCPEGYIDTVVNSFQDNPIRLRAPKYSKITGTHRTNKYFAMDSRIALVVNDRHEIHQVHDRGYVEAPVRVNAILKEIIPTGLFENRKPKVFAERHITAVHDTRFVHYLQTVCRKLPAGKSVYPYVFPIRNQARPPKELFIRAGYYCIDTFTPLNHNAFLAAKRAVDCTLTAAHCLLEGHRIAYALVRPPGHHAEANVFGGFCYFNSTAIAAHLLSGFGKVAILDIDYHHGNGQQMIFYQRPDVLTVSIHGHPRFTYPYFSGFSEERGSDDGTGYNLNIPLEENISGERYRRALEVALRRIRRYEPNFLVVALGLDTARGDPTGSWNLRAADFQENGRMIGSLGLPIIVVQEGGYRVRSLGINARSFFTGLWQGCHQVHPGQAKEKTNGGTRRNQLS